jgi:DNA processing protein
MQVVEHTAVQLALPESAEEAAILTHLANSSEPQHIDDLSRQTGMPSAMVSSTLTLLELKGVVQHVGGMKYVR